MLWRHSNDEASVKEELVIWYLCNVPHIDISHRHDRMIPISGLESSSWLMPPVGMGIVGYRFYWNAKASM